jgi:drug/metabolite transporter (DMT)-like permease
MVRHERAAATPIASSGGQRRSRRALVTGRTLALTAATMVCFAGNSLLCRAALAAGAIDAMSFTLVRIVSGAVVLALLARLAARGRDAPSGGSWRAAAILVLYAFPFSFAYLRLGAGVGALVLFACVQATMIGWGIRRGERPGAREWAGITLALGGLAALTLPGAHAPDPIGVALMAVAGVGWGGYSLLGRGAADPLATNADNFLRSVPLAAAAALALLLLAPVHVTARGAALAATSGGLASGVGYSIWYAALRGLTATRAAVVQLAVPVLAALGGILFLQEAPTARLAGAGAAILGGIALVVTARRGVTGPGAAAAPAK